MTKLSRRSFLATLALGAAACAPVVDQLSQPDMPDTLNPLDGTTRDPIAHLLNRAAYGPRPGQIAAVRNMGRAQWIDAQLDYNSIDDGDLTLRLRRYDTLSMSPADMYSFSDDETFVRNQLALVTLMRASFSERQLYEVIVGFWSDHFSLYHFKDEVAWLKTVDDREVVRRHALGTFGDLLRASAHSPAMLRYLDNNENEKSHPNENYAREIMELHTLGVDGGYTEFDIKEVARCFTGWTMTARGDFTFNSDWHDEDEKLVLGHVIPAGGGKEDGDRAIEILLDHTSTSAFVCGKLVRRFVGDDPPAGITAACVETWRGTGGDIRAVMRTLLAHPEFDQAPLKFKRPLELAVSLIRATGARYNGAQILVDRLEDMAHRPFGNPTPDGYPDIAEKWSGNMLPRWNLGLDAFTGALPGVDIDCEDLARRGGVDGDSRATLRFFAGLLFQRRLPAQDEATLVNFATREWGGMPDLGSGEGWTQMRTLLGLMAASDAFQWR